MDESFYKLKKTFQKKYEKAFNGQYIQTVTGAKLYISGNIFFNLIFNTSIVRAIVRQYLKLKLFISGNY